MSNNKSNEQDMKYIHYKGKYTAVISGGRATLLKGDIAVGYLPKEVVTESQDWGEYSPQTESLISLFNSLNPKND